MYDIDDCITLIGAVIDRWLEDAATAARRGDPTEIREAIHELGLPVSETLRRFKVPVGAWTATPKPAIPKPVKVCGVCGTEIVYTSDAAAAHKRRYCSTPCLRKATNERQRTARARRRSNATTG